MYRCALTIALAALDYPSDDDSDGFEFEDDDNDKSFETTVELEQHETYTLLTPAQFDQYDNLRPIHPHSKHKF